MNFNEHKMRGEVGEGLLYKHGRANSNTAKLLDVSSFAYAAVELLAEKGLIDIEDLDCKKKEIAGRLVEKFRQEGIGAAYQDPEHDKYTFESTVEIDSFILTAIVPSAWHRAVLMNPARHAASIEMPAITVFTLRNEIGMAALAARAASASPPHTTLGTTSSFCSPLSSALFACS
jgi:hypothetical protein